MVCLTEAQTEEKAIRVKELHYRKYGEYGIFHASNFTHKLISTDTSFCLYNTIFERGEGLSLLHIGM